MKFLLDANLPARLADVFAAGGHECVHMEALLPRYAEDTDIALIANQLGAVLVSRDADFVHLSRSGRLRVAVVWVRLGNLRRAALAATMRDRLAAIVRHVDAGEKTVIVR
jgi:predicted nuclease of predicted toxin-antitoxin system